MAERSGDWFRQAERDLESAKAQQKDGFFEWSCFIAQQAAEKAIKALFQKIGAEALGHSLMELLESLPESHEAAPPIRDAAHQLDRYYITARSPNAWAEGTPSQYYRSEDAQKAIDHSQAILRFCHDLLAR